MGRGCRGSPRAERNRNGALQPERVCETSFELLPSPGEGWWLDRGTVFGDVGLLLWGPWNQIPHP